MLTPVGEYRLLEHVEFLIETVRCGGSGLFMLFDEKEFFNSFPSVEDVDEDEEDSDDSPEEEDDASTADKTDNLDVKRNGI